MFQRFKFALAIFLPALVSFLAFGFPGPAAATPDHNHGSTSHVPDAKDHNPPDHHGRAKLEINQTAEGKIKLNREKVPAGLVNIKIKSQVTSEEGFDIAVFQLQPGVALDDLIKRFDIVFSEETSGPELGETVAWINQHAQFYGGAPGGPASDPLKYQVVLPAGKYYALDLVRRHEPQAVAIFCVSGHAGDATLPPTNQAVLMTGHNEFEIDTHDGHSLHNGPLGIVNDTHQLHFVDFQPLKAGTTNDDIAALFAGTGPDPFLQGGSSQSFGVISPGVSVNLHLSLPPGTYGAFCFVPDEETGIPHAFTGMYEVVQVASQLQA